MFFIHAYKVVLLKGVQFYTCIKCVLTLTTLYLQAKTQSQGLSLEWVSMVDQERPARLSS